MSPTPRPTCLCPVPASPCRCPPPAPSLRPAPLPPTARPPSKWTPTDTAPAPRTRGYWRVQVVYRAPDGRGNVLTPRRLRAIHAIEQALQAHPLYQEHAARVPGPDGRAGPAPLNSLLNYLWPSARASSLVYDGRGRDMGDVAGVLRAVLARPRAFWYVSPDTSARGLHSAFLRSEIVFGGPLPGYSLEVSACASCCWLRLRRGGGGGGLRSPRGGGATLRVLGRPS